MNPAPLRFSDRDFSSFTCPGAGDVTAPDAGGTMVSVLRCGVPDAAVVCGATVFTGAAVLAAGKTAGSSPSCTFSAAILSFSSHSRSCSIQTVSGSDGASGGCVEFGLQSQCAVSFTHDARKRPLSITVCVGDFGPRNVWFTGKAALIQQANILTVAQIQHKTGAAWAYRHRKVAKQPTPQGVRLRPPFSSCFCGFPALRCHNAPVILNKLAL